MPKFLIDANLPYYFSLWNNENYIHQNDINQSATDYEIWEFCKKNNLIIITKDADFSNRILLNEPPPKVIHIRFGNLKINQFHQQLSLRWDEVLELIENYKLVNLFIDRIEALK